jgi:hypothetical protein
METLTESKELVPNPHFSDQRNKVLKGINFGEIDAPIREIIKSISKLEYCFTLQCCYGHFLYHGQSDLRNTEPLPVSTNITRVDYRIAYISFCIKENREGEALLESMAKMTLIDPEYIQFGCAEWFWERHKNSFVLQVEPERFKDKDRIVVDYKEAVYIEKIRNLFYIKLNEIVENIVK